MDDRNKDLPLIVSEILIEMHEMKENIQEMNQTLNRVASVVLQQQEHTNKLLIAFQEESRKNMEFMTYSLTRVVGQQQEVNKEFDERLQHLERKFN